MLRRIIGSIAAVALAAACGIDQTDDANAGATSSTSSSSATAGVGGSAATGGPASTGGSAVTQDNAYQDAIACGSAMCKVPTQQCCVFGGSTSCIDASSPCGASGANEIGTPVLLYCDDASDCPMGQQCCISSETNLVTYQCAPNCMGGLSSCIFGVTPCTSGLCVIDAASPVTGARCNPDGALPCGTASCSGSTPVCCAASGSASCTQLGACQGAAFLCSTTVECGSSAACCGDASGSTCAPSCTASQLTLCGTVADCPPNAKGKMATDCGAAPTGSLPAGYKACVY